MSNEVKHVELVPIKQLKLAPWNPKTRTTKLRNLVASIEEHGLFYPILVTKTNQIVDGHRRLAACSELGWTEIPVLRTEREPSSAFGEVTLNVRKLSGNETLQVYLQEPKAIANAIRARMDGMSETLGRSLLERMAKTGLSWRTYKVACSVAHYLDRNTKDFICRATKWMIAQGTTGLVSKAIAADCPPRVLLLAVTKNKPLSHNFSVK